MFSSFKSLIINLSIFAAILLAGCGSDPLENTSGSSVILAELGEPYTQIATETHRQNNCDGSDQGLKISRNLQLEQNVNYYVETGIEGLIEGEVPAVLRAQIQAAIDSGVSQSWGEYSSRGVEFVVKIDPRKVAEHTVAWRETKVDGVVEIRATAGIGRVRFIKTVAVELENRTSTERACDEIEEPLPVSCTVPNLVGLEQSAAQYSIQQLGLNATISTQYSEDAPLGIILSQNPPPKTELSPCQGSVGILVSLGSVLTPTPTATNTPLLATNTPILPTPIPPTQSMCGGAVTIGPWPPVNGQGQDIPIDSGNSFVHADFWSPSGVLKEGCDEVSVLIEPGVMVTVLGVAGQGWKYDSGCSREYVMSQIEAHQQRRNLEGKKMCMANLTELRIK